MKTFKFDFNLSCWIQNLEIEADDYEEAFEKLRTMSVEDIVEEGYVHNFDITDLDCDYDYDEDNEEDEDDFEDED